MAERDGITRVYFYGGDCEGNHEAQEVFPTVQGVGNGHRGNDASDIINRVDYGGTAVTDYVGETIVFDGFILTKTPDGEQVEVPTGDLVSSQENPIYVQRARILARELERREDQAGRPSKGLTIIVT